MKKYKSLYVNGCSYTVGDNLDDEYTWPHLVSKKINLNLINQAKNGNSFQSIVFNSVNHLSSMNAKNTMVIIGITWSSRYMVQFGDSVVNITNSDLVQNNTKIKFSSFRRLSSPKTISGKELFDLMNFDVNEGSSEVLKSFTDFYKSLVQHDYNLKNNQILNLLTNLILLQSFLKNKKFDYKFISFGSLYGEDVLSSNCEQHKLILNDFDYENLIQFDSNSVDICKKTKHPSELGCRQISEVILDIINR
jgi:hypothetical protein